MPHKRVSSSSRETARFLFATKKLSKAVADEDFEEAAILRDEIKQTKARVANIATT